MIDWFVNLEWYWEIPVGLVGIIATLYWVWATCLGFVVGIMRCGSGDVGAVRTVFTIVTQTLIAPVEFLYLVVRHKLKK